jgi:hypothetical protein
MCRALRRQVVRQRLPLATRREHVEDCVENLANIHLAPTAASLGWRDHRLNQRPFGIRQIARLSQTTPLSGAAIRPHNAVPSAMPVYEFRFVALAANPSSSSRRIASDREGLSCCCLAQFSIADLIARGSRTVRTGSRPVAGRPGFCHGCMSMPYGGVPVCGAAGRRALKRPVVPLCV